MSRWSRVLGVILTHCTLLPLIAQNVITTVAGSPFVFRGDGRLATSAALGDLPGVTVDASGNVFVADSGNHLVVKVSPDGTLTVVAGNGTSGFSGDGGPATSAALRLPSGVAVDGAGNLYIADTNNSRIRKVTPAGTISTVAGNGEFRFSGDGGAAPSASLNVPTGVAADVAGNLYIADTNNSRIRKVTPAGTISTVAGNGQFRFSGDGGPATSASLSAPDGVAVDAAGNLYIADTTNGYIRKVNPAGIISTVAGNGDRDFSGDGGPAINAALYFPSGVAVDAAGNFYVADSYNHRIRKVTPSGIIGTVAGRTFGFAGDGGAATNASLAFPSGVAVDPAGNLHIADRTNYRIRRVTPSGSIGTVAGNGDFRFAGDGGPATSAAMGYPYRVAVDSAGNLYIADRFNHRIRKVSPSGMISTVAGTGARGFSGDGGPASSASLYYPYGVAVDRAGNLFIADTYNHRIRKVTLAGTINTVAGNGTTSAVLGDGGPATSAALYNPSGVTVDAAGNLYIADHDNDRIRKVTPAGIISTVAGNGIFGSSGDGGLATSAAIGGPNGVAVDAAGNLYIATLYDRIRKVTPAGTISTVAGNGTAAFSGDGGPATSASLRKPNDVVVDAAGNLYIADTENSRVRKVTPAGIISTVAGTGTSSFSGDGGLATSAAVASPYGVAVDGAGNLYLADTANYRIRKVLATAPSFTVLPTLVSVTASAGIEIPVTRQIAVSSEVIGLAWTVQASDPWLSVSPASGAVPGVITVSVDASSLTPGTYRSTVTVTAPLAAPTTRTASVELTVTQGLTPLLKVEPGAVVVEIPVNTGNPPQQTLRVSNSGGGGALTWTAQGEIFGGGNWLGVLSTSGSASGRAAANIPVRINVAGLQPGIYSGLVQVTSSGIGQTQAVPVTLLLSQPTKSILTTQRGMRFTAAEDSRSTVAQSLGIINTGQGTMDWTIETNTLAGGSWLNVTPASGQSQAGSLNVATASVQANPASLPAGSYSGLLRVNAAGANNSPYFVTVEQEVMPAGASASVQVRPPQLIFTAQAGTSSPGSQNVRLVTPQSAAVEARGGLITLAGGDWIEILPSNLVLSASDPRDIVVQPRLGNLAPGVYRGALTFQFSDGSDPQSVDIIFVVVGTPLGAASTSGAAACTPQRLLAADRTLGKSFTATAGSGTGLEVQLVDDCANPVSSATVLASFSNGDPPVTLASLGNGIYSGTWRPVTAVPQVTVTLRGTVAELPAAEILAQGRVQANDNAPALFAGGIVNAASFASGAALAPGSIVSVFGRNLATTGNASGIPLPRTLGGATLTVGGVDAPLFYSSTGQINAQLPFELPPNTRQQAVVRGAATITLPETVTIAPARPGIFTLPGSTQGAILDVQSRVVDSAAAATAGDIVVVYATGLGAVDRAVATGQAAPGDPPANARTPVTVTIGGQPAVVHFAGLTPGFVGLYQVNVQIPAGVTPGSSVPLVLLQSGVPSNSATLAIR